MISRKDFLGKTSQNTVVNGVSFTPLSKNFPKITIPTTVFVMASHEKGLGHGLKIVLPHVFDEEEFLHGSVGCTARSLQRSSVLLFFFSFFFFFWVQFSIPHQIDFAADCKFPCLRSSEKKTLSLTASVKKYLAQKCSDIKKDHAEQAEQAEANE